MMRQCIFLRVVNVLPSLHAVNNSEKIRHKFSPTVPHKIAEPMVDTKSEAYRSLAHELTLLSTEEFGRRLHRFSRTNFDPSHTVAVHAHVSELLERRVHEVNVKCAREYCHLAHVANLHRLCLELYYTRASIRAHTSLTDGESTKVGDFAPSDFVVDSAYHLFSTLDLIRLASYCVKHLQREPPLGWEVMSAFSLVRAFWRCICIGSHHGRQQQNVEAKQALRDAAYIYDECIALVYPNSYKNFSTQDIIGTVKRFVQYASSGDEGEMLFFRFCLQKGFLRRPSERMHQQGGGSDRGSNMNETIEGGKISEEQWFYATLIATCRVGNHVDSALRYFDDIGSFLGIEHVSCKDLLCPSTRKMSQEQDNDSHSPAKVTGSKDKKAMEEVSEYLIFQLLNVLQTAKDNRRIVFFARTILRDGGHLGISVWSVVLIAVGEMRAVDLALAAFTQAKGALVDPNRALDRRGSEYLLQTSIHALSKCQVPRFEEDYLRPCHEQRLMHCTDEFYYCALLQHAHNSMDPAASTEEVMRRMKESGTPLTTRIVSRLIKIYLRIESPKLLELYQHATERLSLFKLSWLDELLLWADRRRYHLTREERKYILDELQRVHGAKNLQGDLGGLRTQYALLRYDYEYSPLEVFASTSHPPEAEPTILDSRAHFLIKKPYCVVRYARDGHDFTTSTNTTTTIGDPDRTQRFLRSALLTTEVTNASDGEQKTEEFRVYMGRMLEAIQMRNNCAV